MGDRIEDQNSIFQKRNLIIPSSNKRGICVVTKDQKTGDNKEIFFYRKSFAVIIGIDKYKNLPPDMQLNYAVKDARSVEKILSNHFCFDKIYTLYNQDATKEQIINVLSGKLINTTEEDSVFIFWAGHGYTEKTSLGGYLGYLIPYGGTIKDNQLHKNISMTLIKEDISKRIPAKHIFYVMDSCYSGILSSKRSVIGKPKRSIEYLREITNEVSRQVLTAGSINQQVLDGGPKGHSVFAGRFIELLKNTDDYITALEVSTFIKEKVFSDAKAAGHIQTPTYGVLYGLGDYVFVPSVSKNAKVLNDDIFKVEEKLKQLNKQINTLERAIEQADSERKRRQIELQKKMTIAKKKAEELKLERIRVNKIKAKIKAENKLIKEQELLQFQNQRRLELAILKQEVEKKRKLIGKLSYSSISPAAVIKEIDEINNKIHTIKNKYHRLLDESNMDIEREYNENVKQIGEIVKSEFETRTSYDHKISNLLIEVSEQKNKRSTNEKIKIINEYNKIIKPFIKEIVKLFVREFNIPYQDLNFQIGTYNAEIENFPVTLQLKNNYSIPTTTESSVFVHREKARKFKQHFQNNIIRPVIKICFPSVNHFIFTEACLIDDSTTEKYELLNLKMTPASYINKTIQEYKFSRFEKSPFNQEYIDAYTANTKSYKKYELDKFGRYKYSYYQKYKKNQTFNKYNKLQMFKKDRDLSAISSQIESDNLLFPLYKVTLGKTSVNELARLGKINKYVDDETGRPLIRFYINGILFWCENGVANRFYINHRDPMPEKWKKLDFNWDKSYKEWLYLLDDLGYFIKVIKPPQVGVYDGHESFEAEIEAFNQKEMDIKIEFCFKYSKEITTFSKGTLYTIRVHFDKNVEKPTNLLNFRNY